MADNKKPIPVSDKPSNTVFPSYHDLSAHTPMNQSFPDHSHAFTTPSSVLSVSQLLALSSLPLTQPLPTLGALI